MTTLAERVGRLQVVLQAEEDLYVRMRSLLRREEEELIRLDPSDLDRTVAEKHALAEEGRLLEESRIVLTRELCEAMGLSSEPIKLSALIETLGPDAMDLPEIHGRLTALVASSHSLLEANELFASRSFDRVRETLKMLGRSGPEVTSYGPGSGRGSSATRGRLVRAAI